jgi:hypothetical protein
MTLKDKSIIERALGLIEGLAYGVETHISNGLIAAVEMISEVVDRECEGDTE